MSGTTAARNIFRVFVGNLPWTIGSKELRQLASHHFGNVNSAIVIFNKDTGMSKGYGFINFGNREAYTAATMSGAGSLVWEGNRISIQQAASATNSVNMNDVENGTNS